MWPGERKVDDGKEGRTEDGFLARSHLDDFEGEGEPTEARPRGLDEHDVRVAEKSVRCRTRRRTILEAA